MIGTSLVVRTIQIERTLSYSSDSLSNSPDVQSTFETASEPLSADVFQSAQRCNLPLRSEKQNHGALYKRLGLIFGLKIPLAAYYYNKYAKQQGLPCKMPETSAICHKLKHTPSARQCANICMNMMP